MPDRKMLPAALRDFRYGWKDLALTDIAYKSLAYVALVPVAGLLLHLLIALSGRTVVADEDIVQFLLEPLGWLCLVVVGAVLIAIAALEQAALMGVVAAAQVSRHLGVTRALMFAGVHGWSVLRVTTRVIGLSCLAAVPFLAAAGITYLTLLSRFDINYYLTQKPLEFKISVGIAAVLAVGLSALWLRLATSWFYALPLVVFERVKPAAALRVSRDRVRGHRHLIVAWIVTWLVVTFLLSALVSGGVTLLARALVPYAINSLGLLLFAVGSTLVVWAVVNLATSLLSTTTFAVMFFRLYADLGCPQGIGRSLLETAELETTEVGAWGIRIALTRRRLASLIIAAVLAATAVGYIAFRSVRAVNDVQIIAHRGASDAAPENTLAAIEQAVAEGADWAEFDVQETADGQVVVFHDSDFKKLANVDLKIWNATTDDLRNLDVGSWFGPEFADQRVPTLAQVLAYCKGKIRCTIELKFYGHNQQLEQRVAEIVEASDMQDEIVIISLKQDLLDTMKQLRPNWRTGLLTAVAVGKLTKVKADFLAVNANIATRSFIRSAHQQNKQVLVWTVNDPISMSTMIGRGVDGLITDKPGLARQVLLERAELSSVERLLIELAGLLGVKREVTQQ